MSINNTNINLVWTSLIVEELVRHGIDYFCISPGSRSTPLTAAAAYNQKTKSRIHFDERGAAFHALGYARAAGKPAALICTSGTAVANYLPAVVEASMDGIPMILLTADRPEKLRGTGANQTIIQPGIFSHYVNYEIDLPCPNEKENPEFVLNTVDRAVADAFGTPPGPVHLNCQFDEPLTPGDSEQNFSEYLSGIASWLVSDRPLKKCEPLKASVLSADIDRVAKILNRTKNGLMVVGRLRNLDETAAVLDLSRKLGWPVFPDVLSGLRLGCNTNELIHHYDLLLVSEEFKTRLKPEIVLHLGGPFTSKRLSQFLQTCQYDEYILISDYRHKDSPELKVTCRINNDIAAFTDKLCPKLVPCEHERLHILKLANMTAREFILRETSIEKRITQPGAAYLTMHLTDINSALFLASSLPIRDMDSFGPICERPMPVGANRGASGIDGTVASASGFAVGHKKPVTLLIGDLALLHDINSLALLKDNPSPVTVVVVNNGGGNIFQRLPVARCEDIFEKYFLTPHPFDFEKAAAMFGLNYYHPESVEELIKALEKRAVNENSTLIEIKIDAAQNQKNYDKLLIKFAERLDKISRLGNDACRFGYITSGSPEKPAVLLLHGFMGDKSDWRDIVPHLENDFYIVAVDLPGHGETFVNGPEDFYSMPNTARAIVHFLESNEISKTHLLGYSMGGRLGHYLLFAFPGYFEKAVLESSSPGYEVIGDMRKRIIDDDALAERLNHEDFRQFLEYWYGQPLFEGIKNDPERFERLLQKRLKNQPGELARSLRYMGTGMMPSLWANLKKIKNQILFIAGGNDDRYKKIAEEMSDLCPYGEVCIIKDCGHNVHFEKPREYAEQVKQFLLR